MLKHFFQCPRRLERMRSKPFGEHMDGLAARLHGLGFTRSTTERILSLTGKFNGFALGVGVEDAAGIDERLVERFVNGELKAQGKHQYARSLMQHILDHLRVEGVIPEGVLDPPEDPYGSLLADYDSHLLSVRGLAASSRKQYLRHGRRLLEWYEGRRDERALCQMTGVDVLDYVAESAALHPSGSWRNNLCSLARSFLRFLQWAGILEVGLYRVVPRVPHWRLQSIPRHLPWEQVRAVIDSVDASTASGLRDKAVLVLIATLGLRSQEVRDLRLSDLHWRTAEIYVAKTKSRRERNLPLPQEVGEAIAQYVMHGRPALDVPQVFLRHRAPQGPITSTHGLGDIVRKHLLRAGIKAPSYGTHVLRHSLATRMVNKGVAIKEIADVLGHSSIDTTAIYTKVDKRSLSAVALPFPGGEA